MTKLSMLAAAGMAAFSFAIAVRAPQAQASSDASVSDTSHKKDTASKPLSPLRNVQPVLSNVSLVEVSASRSLPFRTSFGRGNDTSVSVVAWIKNADSVLHTGRLIVRFQDQQTLTESAETSASVNLPPGLTRRLVSAAASSIDPTRDYAGYAILSIDAAPGYQSKTENFAIRLAASKTAVSAWSHVVWITAILAGLACALARVSRLGVDERPVSGAEWNISQSWAANLTVAGSLATALTSGFLPLNTSAHLARSEYQALAAAFGGFILIAPATFAFMSAKYAGSAAAAFLAFTLVYCAAIGQLLLVGLLGDEARCSGVLPGSFAGFFILVILYAIFSIIMSSWATPATDGLRAEAVDPAAKRPFRMP